MEIEFDPRARYEVEERDVPFARPAGQELLARIYQPRGASSKRRAAVVDVHGGAWARLDRTAGAIYGRALAACGLVVASLDFRQAPEYQHPAAAADVSAGVRWMRSHADELNVDPENIGLCGSSSGGHLALLVAVTPGNPAHAGTPIVRPDGSLDDASSDDSVDFALAFYPVADPIARYRYALTREHEPPPPSGFDAKRLIASHRAYFRDEADMATASVTRIVSAGEAKALPPTWVAQPELDDNVPASITEALLHAYQDAGGSIEHAIFPGARHGFLQQEGSQTDSCIRLMREFIGRQIAKA